MGRRKSEYEIDGFVLRTHTRCEDCEYRGDLDAVGRPVQERRARISRCRGCNGSGQVPLFGVDRIDPMARKK